MLKVEFKRQRSTKWEMTVRWKAKDISEYCDSLIQFCLAFNTCLSKMKRDSVGFIGDSYRAEIVGDKVEINLTAVTTGEKTLIVIITK